MEFYDERPDETKTDDFFQRSFGQDANEENLVWHRDRRNRTIRIIAGVNWKLQMDNKLPVIMKVGDVFEIPKETFHRVHKGEGRLIIEIKEF
jgi:hypothetical protein